MRITSLRLTWPSSPDRREEGRLASGERKSPPPSNPARMRVVPPAGRMPPELRQRSQRAEHRHDPSALGVHAAAAAGGGGAERVRLPAATATCTRFESVSALRHAACGTVAGDVNACPSGRSPRAAAWGRHTVTAKASTPQVGMAQGAHVFREPPAGGAGTGEGPMNPPAPVSSLAVVQVVLWGAWSESQEKGTSAAMGPPGAHPRSPAGDSRSKMWMTAGATAYDFGLLPI